MEEVTQYLINKIKDLVEENINLISEIVDYNQKIYDNIRYKEMIKYIYDELHAFSHDVSEEAKIGLITYIEEKMDGVK